MHVCHPHTQWLLKNQLGGQWLWPVHRLDRATSGVTVYCKSEAAASRFGEQMRARRVRKSYLALVRGFTDTYGAWEAILLAHASAPEGICSYATDLV